MRRLLLLAFLTACSGEPKPPAPPPVAAPIRAALVAQGRFTVGQAVKTTATAYIRSSPWHGNTSSNVLATAPKGATGSILDGPVIDTSSDGDRWGRWKVAMTSPLPTGWVADTYLVAATVVPPPPPPPPPSPPPPPPPPPAPLVMSVSPVAASIRLGGPPLRFRATVMDSTGTVVPRTVIWSSGNSSVAMVDTAGWATGTGVGATLITATIGTVRASGQLTIMARLPKPFNGIYAEVRLRNGRIRIARQDATHLVVFVRDTVADTTGAFGGAAFVIRTSTAPGYAAGLRQLVSDLPGLPDTVRFQTANPLGVTSVVCTSAGCAIVAQTPGHATWTSAPLLTASPLLGLAHALEAAARGDTLFAPGDSLPYVRSIP